VNKRLVAWIVLVMCAQGLVGCGQSDSSYTPSAPSPPHGLPSPRRPPIDLTGNHLVTFEADRSCEQLPAELRTRTYEAIIGYVGPSQNGTRDYFRAELSGAHFDGYYRTIFIGVMGNDVYFDFSDNFIVEEPEPDTYLTILGGNEKATVDPSDLSTISTPFDGHFLYCVTNSEFKFPYSCPAGAIAYSACRSTNSRWTLTRR
jgi:hypothetical protein